MSCLVKLEPWPLCFPYPFSQAPVDFSSENSTTPFIYCRVIPVTQYYHSAMLFCAILNN